ncbi:unnamed protein product [Heterosigma akashiwo]|mmetsp:Transcript_55138/g.80493  ORF Transcript_55138/g.80493 Transcript_55138/m.80493 type:complete len:105 (+) Transcript_55138:37-351(+)
MDALKEIDPKVIMSIAAICVSMAIMMATAFKKPPALVNLTIQKDNPKVVDKVSSEDIKKAAKDGKLVMCRCWKSKKFPYCDGAHAKHNTETGDNTGPLIIECSN